MWRLDQLLGVFAPFECLGCGREGDVICATCLCSLPLPTDFCYRCRQKANGVVCQPCMRQTHLSHITAVCNYQDQAADLLAALKFERAQSAAKLVGLGLHLGLPRLPANIVVTHIPTANSRVRQRGYDQARLIARSFASYRQLPYAGVFWRRGHSRQLGANRTQRLLQLRSNLLCPRPEQVAGKNFLMIDDVLTTGATIETAAKVLVQHGAASVGAALFAQKI